MATRTLLFDLAQLDGVDTTPYRAQVQVSLLRPQQDNETTITTTPLPVPVDGPTRVEVPVTGPGNALVIQWPPHSSQTATTYHLVLPGDGDLVAATLPLVDRATLADPEVRARMSEARRKALADRRGFEIPGWVREAGLEDDFVDVAATDGEEAAASLCRALKREMQDAARVAA